MKRILKLSPCLLLGSALACGSATPAEPAPPVSPAPNAAPAPAPTTEPAKAEPTEADKKKQEELAKLEADRKKMKAEHEAEVKRLDEKIRGKADKLAQRQYFMAQNGIKAAMKGEHRQPGHAERDKYRRPVQTMEFFGLTPTMTVLEYGPGQGWYTELLAPTLAKRGKLIVTTADPDGPKDQRATYYAERLRLFLDRLPEAYGDVESVIVDPKKPDLKLKETVDLALVIRGMHGLVRDGKLDAWLSEIHEALKPKGVLGVVQHRAKEGADPKQAAKQGYLPEKWLIKEIEKAGFKLEKKSELNANPKDTADHPEGVWTLPPSLRLGDKDKKKYEEIGESDRMTLKFVKVEKPKAEKKADKAEKKADKKADKAEKKADKKADKAEKKADKAEEKADKKADKK